MDQKSRGQGRCPAEREDSARAIDGTASTPSLLPMTSVSSPGPRPSSSRLVESALSILIGMRLGICELYRRARAEFLEELPLLKTRWKLLLLLASWQYFHGALSQLAHRLHSRPLPQPLPDAGFALLPELGPRAREWASELVFSAMFASFVAWSFSPFFRDCESVSAGNGDGSAKSSLAAAAAAAVEQQQQQQQQQQQGQQQQQQQQQQRPPPPPAPPPLPSPSSPPPAPIPILPASLRALLPAPRPPRFHTAVLYGRVLTTLCACQLLRALSFLSTSLPGPNYHCRAGSAAATLAMPARWWGHLVVDVGEQATKGCGDLIFSSHTTFALVGCLAYSALGNHRIVKIVLWAAAAALSLLIVASRKHYTVDVVVAWYVVPLVWSFASRRWTTPERGKGGSGGGGGASGCVGGGERGRGSGVGGGREGGGGASSGSLGKGGAKQRKGEPLLRRPSLIAAASSSSGSGFVVAGGDGGDVEEGGLPASCGTCPSCGGAASAT